MLNINANSSSRHLFMVHSNWNLYLIFHNFFYFHFSLKLSFIQFCVSYKWRSTRKIDECWTHTYILYFGLKNVYITAVSKYYLSRFLSHIKFFFPTLMYHTSSSSWHHFISHFFYYYFYVDFCFIYILTWNTIKETRVCTCFSKCVCLWERLCSVRVATRLVHAHAVVKHFTRSCV